MRDPGLIELRRHDPDIFGQSAGDFLDDFQAGGMDAVVIGAENPHSLACPQSIPSRSGSADSPSLRAIQKQKKAGANAGLKLLGAGGRSDQYFAAAQLKR